MTKLIKYINIFLLLAVSSLIGRETAFELKKTGRGFEGTAETRIKADLKGSLEIKEISGDIFIEGTDDNHFVCKEMFKVKSHNKSTAMKMYQAHKAGVQPKNNHILIKGGKTDSEYSSNFEISVPRTYSINTISNGGDITIIRVESDISIKTSGGDLEGSGLKGNIVFSTSGGDVSIENSQGDMKAITSGGNIELEKLISKIHARSSGGNILIHDIKGDGSAKTSGGSIDLDLIEGDSFNVVTSGGNITAENSNINLIAKTFGGNIRISKATKNLDIKTLGGNINLDGLDGNLRAKSSGGNINVGNVTGSAYINTSGGDITIKSVNENGEFESSGGSITIQEAYSDITAHTSGGNIWVQKFNNENNDKNNVDLFSSGGDLTCFLSNGISARIKAKIKMKKDRYNIQSEFNMQKTKEYKKGKYFLEGESIINQGEALVNLETKEGDITIKEINN